MCITSLAVKLKQKKISFINGINICIFDMKIQWILFPFCLIPFENDIPVYARKHSEGKIGIWSALIYFSYWNWTWKLNENLDEKNFTFFRLFFCCFDGGNVERFPFCSATWYEKRSSRSLWWEFEGFSFI